MKLALIFLAAGLLSVHSHAQSCDQRSTLLKSKTAMIEVDLLLRPVNEKILNDDTSVKQDLRELLESYETSDAFKKRLQELAVFIPPKLIAAIDELLILAETQCVSKEKIQALVEPLNKARSISASYKVFFKRAFEERENQKNRTLEIQNDIREMQMGNLTSEKKILLMDKYGGVVFAQTQSFAEDELNDVKNTYEMLEVLTMDVSDEFLTATFSDFLQRADHIKQDLLRIIQEP